MSIEALKAARAAMTNVVAVYDKGIAGHLVEDAFNKVRAAIAQADAALSSAALEASATLATTASTLNYPTEHDMKPPIIIYHGNCADGWTSAWIAKKAIGGDVELHAGVYGQPLPDVKDRTVYLLDFSYPLALMEELVADCNLLVWLDHHDTAIRESGSLLLCDKVTGKLDNRRCGAWLTWEFFHGDKAVPTLVHLVDDRDRWQFKDDRSKPFAAGLFSRNYTEKDWDEAAQTVDTVIAEGEVILKKHHKDIEELLNVSSYIDQIAGKLVPVCNLPYTMASDACQALLERHPTAPFAACWYDRKGVERVYSLRSRECADAVHVGDVAKLYGGGGHKHAAGFAIHVDRLDKLLVRP